MPNPRRTRKQWQRLVSELERSGLSPKAFAATRKGVDPGTLGWWRCRLRREAREREREDIAEPAFLPVVVSASVVDASAEQARGPVEVVLGSGVKLRFEHHLDVEGLSTLATAFGGSRP